MPTSTRTAAELRDASEHLLYEIEMLGHTARLLADGPWKGSEYVWDRTTYFALLESFLTHTRSLMGFIHPAGRGGQDDLRARDFIPGWRPPSKWSTFDRDRDRISQEISHLSFKLSGRRLPQVGTSVS
jgi:hypothetical protein